MQLTDFAGIRTIVRIVTVFVFLLFIIFLLTRKKGNRHGHRLLAGFLLASVILLIDKIFVYYRIERFFPHLWNIGFPFIFFFSPSLYLYTRSMTRHETRMRWTDVLHFVPFASLYVVMFAVVYHFDSCTKLGIIQNAAEYFGNTFFISGCLCEIQFIVYAVLSLKLLNQYRSNLKQYYSALKKINLSWLNLIIYGFLIWRVVYMVYMIRMVYITNIFQKLATHGIFGEYFLFVVEMGFLLFASALVYKALTMPIVSVHADVLKKYKTSPLNETDKKRFLQRIDSFMRVERPYLEPTFTLNDLAKKTSVPIRYVSQVLNETLNQKFYDYVNQYRIEETKKMLSDPSLSGKNITEVFYDAGFNAKSVFNKAFKKHVGLTPRQFRERHQKRPS